MKKRVNAYLDELERFDELTFKEQIKTLCYFAAGQDNRTFNPSDIHRLFNDADSTPPKNIHQYFYQLVDEHFLVSSGKDYRLHRNAIKNNPLISNLQKNIKESHITEEERNHVKALECFDNLNVHPEIKSVSRKLFMDKHYPQAIFEAFKKVNNMVKRKSGRNDIDGKGLMTTVFSKNNPILGLNDLRSSSDLDQQEGYMHLFVGAVQGIRNPKAHEEIVQDNLFTTIKLLCLASLLAQKVDEARKI